MRNLKGGKPSQGDRMSARGIIGGAIGAIIASICYFLPLLLIFAGVSVAAGLVVSQYRPFFLLLGVLFVVFYILLNIYSKTQNSSCSFVEVSKKREEIRYHNHICLFYIIRSNKLSYYPNA